MRNQTSKKTCLRVGCRVDHLVLLSAEDVVGLLGDADERSALREVLEAGRADVGACRADATEHVRHGRSNRAAIRAQHGLALRRTVLSNLK